MQKVLGNKVAIIVFTTPAILLFSVIVFFPITQTLYRSMFQWDGINNGLFIGIENYTELFTNDGDFIRSIINGLIFPLVTSFYQLVLGTILALILASKTLKGKRFFRSSFFIPCVISVVIICKLWLAMLDSDAGIINRILNLFGADHGQRWLSQGTSAIITIAFITAWQGIGNTILLLYGSIKSIPEHYYEAAIIDGASTMQAHFRVTLPMLAETYKFCLILIVSGGLRAFDQIFVMTGGGPGTSTYTLSYLMYSSAFRNGEYGYACAVAIVLVLECLLFTGIINRFVARERITY